MVERLKILKEIDQQLPGWYEELLGRLQEAQSLSFTSAPSAADCSS
jgi:hypothetical protein